MRIGSILLLGAVVSCGGRQSLGDEGDRDTGLPGAAGNVIDAATTGDAARPDAPLQRCGFTMPASPQETSMASPSMVQTRLHQFLSGANPAPLPPPPATVTAEWSAALATQLLDGIADGDAPGGFLRWLTRWYYDGSPPVPPVRWAGVMAQPAATLSNLLTDPNPDNVGSFGYWSDKQLLVDRTSIDRRGMLVLEQLLCGPLIRLPAIVSLPVPSQMPGQTEREAHQQSVTSATCAGCHQLMDPFGHAFGHFDRLGNYRDLDNGIAVDASDTFEGALGSTFTFASIDDLGPQLAQSCEAAQCVASALLREAVAPELAPSAAPPFNDEEVAPIAQAFVDSNFSLRALVRAIVTSPVFLR